MRLGLYRTIDPVLGEVARVHWSVGDAAPFLNRQIYDFLAFQPAFENLPSEDEYRPPFRRRLPRNTAFVAKAGTMDKSKERAKVASGSTIE